MRLNNFFSAVGLAVAATLICSTAASAQAFGIRAGTPVSQLRVILDAGDGAYAVTPPQPNPLFETYGVEAAPGVGVCKVFGIGQDIEHDRDGAKARQRVEQVVAALTARHGQPEGHADRIIASAIWDAPDEWSMAIQQRERDYVVRWGPDTANNIEALQVQVTANRRHTTKVNVTYHFSNVDQCNSYTNAVEARGL